MARTRLTVLVCLWILIDAASGVHYRASTFLIWTNHTLSNATVLKRYDTSSVKQCEFECTKETKCAHFTVTNNNCKMTCELQSAGNCRKFLKPAPMVNFFLKKVSHNYKWFLWHKMWTENKTSLKNESRNFTVFLVQWIFLVQWKLNRILQVKIHCKALNCVKVHWY